MLALVLLPLVLPVEYGDAGLLVVYPWSRYFGNLCENVDIGINYLMQFKFDESEGNFFYIKRHDTDWMQTLSHDNASRK